MHVVLSGASLAMVWLFLGAIIDFVPRAGAFASRMRDTPQGLISPAAYAQDDAETNRAVQARLDDLPRDVESAPVRGTPTGSRRPAI